MAPVVFDELHPGVPALCIDTQFPGDIGFQGFDVERIARPVEQGAP